MSENVAVYIQTKLKVRRSIHEFEIPAKIPKFTVDAYRNILLAKALASSEKVETISTILEKLQLFCFLLLLYFFFVFKIMFERVFF